MEWRKDGSHATVGEVLELFAEPEGKQWRAAIESRSGLGLWINAPYATQKDAQRAAEDEALRLLQEAIDEITSEDDAQRRGETSPTLSPMVRIPAVFKNLGYLPFPYRPNDFDYCDYGKNLTSDIEIQFTLQMGGYYIVEAIKKQKLRIQFPILLRDGMITEAEARVLEFAWPEGESGQD